MTNISSRSTVYGYPRQGADRQLKRAIESYWAGRSDADALSDTARALRLERLSQLRAAGIEEIPSNDFSLYDHVLDTIWMLGAIPARHATAVPDVSTPTGRLDRYFAMARGTAEAAPLEMTKWFNTNYHFLVPELGPDSQFTLDAGKPLAEFAEASQAGIVTRPVVLGPISFLLLAKAEPNELAGFQPLALLDHIVPLYAELLQQLREAGAEWVQLDEPALVADQPPAVLAHLSRAYAALSAEIARPKILVACYFDRLGEALPVLAATAVEGLAMDFTGPAAANLDDLAAIGGTPGKRLVAGVVDGHNVWVADLPHALDTLGTLLGLAGTLDVSASCSLLHVPLDVNLEHDLDPQLAAWFAFARQKLDEIVTLTRGLNHGRDAIAGELQVNTTSRATRSASAIVRVDAVRARAGAVSPADLHRISPYGERHQQQQNRLQLPLLPTTTIGSFPQTDELRTARADLRTGRIDTAGYEERIRAEIGAVISFQEKTGIDVLVHGEPERNDMVQYFAEQLTGYLATQHGWVQSYGTRYVRPPILAGDISRPGPMTVRWTSYAQSLTDRPVKGMLTGPVTMLAWSFVRDDQPLGDTARQVALALRDEVNDLETAGTSVIQVDEPALRETLPLRAADRPAYLAWATESFRLTTSGAAPGTQIHTH
ncbi:MAG: 5-methyltetrahydropteroyltriglutamate--homocysteine methyltransferase, partial [Pseudonocardiales bacterium]|nr:5-methyltetrahydropteroyltriglutamate--homocysteine methyltransferase [Pseudonocardiales bacterium]